MQAISYMCFLLKNLVYANQLLSTTTQAELVKLAEDRTGSANKKEKSFGLTANNSASCTCSFKGSNKTTR